MFEIRTIQDVMKNPLIKPTYLPGDIVELNNGSFGLIKESHNIINGEIIEWVDLE